MTFLYNGGPGTPRFGCAWARSARFGFKPQTAVRRGRRRTGSSTTSTVCSTRRISSSSTCREAASAASSGTANPRISGAWTKTWPPSDNSSSATSPRSAAGTHLAFSSANPPADAVGGALRLPPRPRRRLNGIVLLSSFLNSNLDYNDGAPSRGRRLGLHLQFAHGDGDRVVSPCASRLAAAERAAPRSREHLALERISRRSGAGGADFGRALQRHRFEDCIATRVCRNSTSAV